VEVIGSGGYADVFLYDQVSPRRQVAIKVLDADLLPEGAASDYTAEADVMGMVSEHPFIVQVFEAGISPDGRPFLVMEYYPGQNFQQRSRSERFSVAEVLRVGIQIAGAVETAHRAGILHRDIKPANILTSKFRKPGLTDFGIAAVDGPADEEADGGLSIPWSPPEAFGAPVTDVRSDVYSLAASCYTMLTGRSPFEQPGGDNRQFALMTRIERDPLPAVGRPDVPVQLERVLAAAMAKDHRHRPASAADFARQLQAVESELHLPITELDLEDALPRARARSADIDDDATRAKSVTQVDAQGAVPAPARSATPPIASVGAVAPSAEPRERRREGLLAEPEVGDTVARPTVVADDIEPYVPARGVPKIYFAAAAAVALIAVVVGSIVMSGGGEADSDSDVETDIAEVNDNFGDDSGGPVAVTPLALEQVDGAETATGSFEFEWEDRGDDVTYSVRVGDAEFTTETDEPSFVSSEPCIEVEVIAPSGLISAPTRGCVSE
jgi:Protein kinase domain